jgi:hypothetical protein
MDTKRELLRHTVATVAYRGAKVVRDAPEEFGDFALGESPKTTAHILAHIGDLYDWALSIARGAQAWRDSTPLPWRQEVERFFAALGRFDACLASDEPLACSEELLFQGPVADSLTHIGQLAMLRRLAGVKMRGENYFKADIVVGRVGPDQTPPRREFD